MSNANGETKGASIAVGSLNDKGEVLGGPVLEVEKLARANILSLSPYHCARDDYIEGVLLDANENPHGPPGTKLRGVVGDLVGAAEEAEATFVREVVGEGGGASSAASVGGSAAWLGTTTASKPFLLASFADVARYPDPLARNLKRMIAARRLARPEEMFVGVGSDEALDLVIRCFCRPGGGEAGDRIVVCPPTYGMYSVCAAVNDVAVDSVPLLGVEGDFQVDLETLRDHLKAAGGKVKVVFLCSPGNPTARQLRREDVCEVLSWPEYTGLVVLDEAYVDFCEPEAQKAAGAAASALSGAWGSAVGRGEGSSPISLREGAGTRLVVTQTLSKAWGLAGIRCGIAFGNEKVIDLFNRVKAPYNLNTLTSMAACSALGGAGTQAHAQFLSNLAAVASGREKLRRALADSSKYPEIVEVLPSDTNFVVFRLKEGVDAKALHKTMADDGVVCRYRGSCLHLANCLRVTVGTEEENEKFLAKLRQHL